MALLPDRSMQASGQRGGGARADAPPQPGSGVACRPFLRARRERYTRARPPADPAGRIVILVDDGIATGSSMLAAIRSLRARRPASIVVAAAVAPPESLARIAAEADEVVCLDTPYDFAAVGQFFDDFSEVTDDMVVEALTRPRAAGARRTV